MVFPGWDGLNWPVMKGPVGRWGRAGRNTTYLSSPQPRGWLQPCRPCGLLPVTVSPETWGHGLVTPGAVHLPISQMGSRSQEGRSHLPTNLQARQFSRAWNPGLSPRDIQGQGAGVTIKGDLQLYVLGRGTAMRGVSGRAQEGRGWCQVTCPQQGGPTCVMDRRGRTHPSPV